jgi:pimeloyl-ACP methyl ester carboxylesterase
MASFVTYRTNPVVVEFGEEVRALEDPVPPEFVREFQESTLAQPVPRAFFEAVVQESLKVPARVWRAAFDGFLEDDFSRELGRIEAPTLIVWGDQDVFAPRSDQETLAAAIAGSRLVVYLGAGHAFHWEEPERFAADLVAFTENVVG